MRWIAILITTIGLSGCGWYCNLDWEEKREYTGTGIHRTDQGITSDGREIQRADGRTGSLRE